MFFLPGQREVCFFNLFYRLFIILRDIFVTSLVYLFRPFLRGEEVYTQMGFFVQTIFADRYIHRRELRLVLLGSSSSVEYGIKKIFTIFKKIFTNF